MTNAQFCYRGEQFEIANFALRSGLNQNPINFPYIGVETKEKKNVRASWP